MLHSAVLSVGIYSFDEARDVVNGFFYLFVFWIRAIKIVDEVKAWGGRADATALQSPALVLWREPVPPEYCITKYKIYKEEMNLRPRTCSRKTNHNRAPTPTLIQTPLHPLYLGSLAVIDQ